jgi:predicted membrane metal-binding protein
VGVFGALSPLNWFFEGLSLIALVFEGFALIDALRRPAAAFVAASKQTKPLWLIILSVATVVGLGYSLTVGGIGAAISILPIVAFVAAAIYLTDVRPRVREFRGGSSSSGPYGPW